MHDDDDDEAVPYWKNPKVLFFFFGSIVLLMLLLGIWVDDGRFVLTGLVSLAPTCVFAVALAFRDMV